MDLSPGDFLSPLDRTPRFGQQDRDLSALGYRFVVVEVGVDEADADWRAGFYRSPLPPREALNRLLRHALAMDLGEANVLRVEPTATVDSEGESTLKLTVVLAPDAVPRISADASIAAFGNLMLRLREVGIKGTPTIQYVTEDELAEGEV
jgi:hypothetical protein